MAEMEPGSDRAQLGANITDSAFCVPLQSEMFWPCAAADATRNSLPSFICYFPDSLLAAIMQTLMLAEFMDCYLRRAL